MDITRLQLRLFYFQQKSYFSMKTYVVSTINQKHPGACVGEWMGVYVAEDYGQFQVSMYLNGTYSIGHTQFSFCVEFLTA